MKAFQVITMATSLRSLGLVAAFGLALAVVESSAAPAATQPLIRVNQIGYLPEGSKVA